jgi:hypothetical protein
MKRKAQCKCVLTVKRNFIYWHLLCIALAERLGIIWFLTAKILHISYQVVLVNVKTIPDNVQCNTLHSSCNTTVHLPWSIFPIMFTVTHSIQAAIPLSICSEISPNERESSRRLLKVGTIQNLIFENFLFQQGYHRGDWLSRVKGKKGCGRGELSCLSGFEGHSTRLLAFFERASRFGWPAKGVASSARRTVRRSLGGRMSISVSKIQFWSCIWKLRFRSVFLTCSAPA